MFSHSISSVDGYKAFRDLLSLVSGSGYLAQSDENLTKELMCVNINIQKTRNILLNHPSVNYPLLFLKQLQYLDGTENEKILNDYELKFMSNQNFAKSAAFLLDDIQPPSFLMDLRSTYNLLSRNPNSRQAYINTYSYRELKKEKGSRKSILLGIQFLIRQNVLHMIVYLRSNEIWKGFLTDMYLFSFFQEVMAAWLNLSTGTYNHFIGSCHLYENNFDAVKKYLNEEPENHINKLTLKFDKSFDETPEWAHSMIDCISVGSGRNRQFSYLNDEYSNWYLDWLC